MDPASVTIEPPCIEGAALVHSEPHGEGVCNTIAGDCVLTLNTIFEHGVIVVTPLTDE